MGKKKVLSESEIKPRLPDEGSEVLGVVEKLLARAHGSAELGVK